MGMSLVQIWRLFSHGDPEEILEVVGFSVVVDVCKGLIKNRCSITDLIFCVGCSAESRAW